MRALKHRMTTTWYWLPIALLAAIPLTVGAQVPVDAEGRAYGDFAAGDDALGNEDIPLRSAGELEELVGPVALYPDDLLAIVLPASTYPLQLVEAARFLEDLEQDPSLEPDENWDDSVVALTNYPEVIELLNEDLDWTWRLGEAVIAQQDDVIAAVESFRDRAYAAGNLKSDAHQAVSRSDEGIIEVIPMEDDIIYVPYYEPEEVVVYQPRTVYYYYPRPYPVYYYPYPSTYAFHRDYFWGVTTAFTIGWYTDRLHVFHHSYRGHPYYGRYYWDRWWYRRPSINVYNTVYVNNTVHRSRDYYQTGDVWRSHQHRRLRSGDGRITRNRYYPGDVDRVRSNGSITRSGFVRTDRAADHRQYSVNTRGNERRRPETSNRTARDRDSAGQRQPREAIRFRERPEKQAVVNRTDRSRDAVRESAVRGSNDLRTRIEHSQSRGAETRPHRSRETLQRSEPKRITRTESTRIRHSEPRRSEPRREGRSEPSRVRKSEPRSVSRSERSTVRRSEPRQAPRSEPQRVTRAEPAPAKRAKPSRSERSTRVESRQGERSRKVRDSRRP